VQVDPIKTKLKPPVSKRLKLRCVVPLTIFALKFNLRRYSTAADKADLAERRAAAEEAEALAQLAGISRAAILRHVEEEAAELREQVMAERTRVVGRCMLTASSAVLKAPIFSALETITCESAFKLCLQSQLAQLQRGRRDCSRGTRPGDAGSRAGLRAERAGRGAGEAAVPAPARVRRRAPGRAVQVDPIKPTLRAPGTQHLKPKCDKLLSNSAFEFNLRRYNQVKTLEEARVTAEQEREDAEVGRCRLTLSNPR